MGYYKPIGTWEQCWECKGKGWVIDTCYECGRPNHDAQIEQCYRCSGVGFTLKREWVRAADDPPPLSQREITAQFVDMMHEGLSKSFNWDSWGDIFAT